MDWQSHWHFVDNPFMDDGFEKDVAPELYNNTWAMNDIYENLKYAKEESGTLPDGDVSYSIGDGLNMRLYVHYVGDVH